MSYEEVFAKVKEIFMKADVSRVEEHLAFQFNITGEGEGRVLCRGEGRNTEGGAV